MLGGPRCVGRVLGVQVLCAAQCSLRVLHCGGVVVEMREKESRIRSLGEVVLVVIILIDEEENLHGMYDNEDLVCVIGERSRERV